MNQVPASRCFRRRRTNNVAALQNPPRKAVLNKNLIWISTLLAVTTGTDIAHSAEKLGEHPAVIVARNWSARGIDPNAFIVAHPARMQLLAKSPSEKQQRVAEAEATAAAGQ